MPRGDKPVLISGKAEGTGQLSVRHTILRGKLMINKPSHFVLCLPLEQHLSL